MRTSSRSCRWLPRGCAMALLFLHASGVARAQDAAPTPEHGGVRLQFVPPPMDGAFSLGVYDAKGSRLIRVLKREAEPEAFIVALNGLITFWDGKNDRGAAAPAGRYSARGF